MNGVRVQEGHLSLSVSLPVSDVKAPWQASLISHVHGRRPADDPTPDTSISEALASSLATARKKCLMSSCLFFFCPASGGSRSELRREETGRSNLNSAGGERHLAQADWC